MLQRFVCFKFNENATESDRQKHMADFGSLKDSITQIVSYSAGYVLENKDGIVEYDTSHYLTFRSQEDIDIYFWHEAHQRFIQENRPNWEKVLVLDAEIE